jgi:uncharacterized repeat protein (TIGR03837 family)
MGRYCHAYRAMHHVFMHNPRMLNAPSALPITTAKASPLRWDVFCRVIDNFGDIGVCWRLCADLAGRGHCVRLWVDDSSALTWMAPGAREGLWPGVQVLDWTAAHDSVVLQGLPPADVWVEGFGCEIAPEFIATRAYLTRASGTNGINIPVWINLEYLSAEAYVSRSHALPSPLMQGPARGWTKHFYYPGFTAGTGGLLREPDYLARQQAFDHAARHAWLAAHGVAWQGERLISLFCYEPPALKALLNGLITSATSTSLIVTAGRAQRAVQALLPVLREQEGPASSPQQLGALTLHQLPILSHPEFDELLWACDLNCVRGEDSLVRALWAGKALLWQIYPQDDGAHAEKLNAFLDTLQADPSLRAAHREWNGLADATSAAQTPALDATLPLDNWATQVQALRQRLLQMDDLGSQLIDFIQKKR